MNKQEAIELYDIEIPIWEKLTQREQMAQKISFESILGKSITLEQAEIAYSVVREIFKNHYVKLLEERSKIEQAKHPRKPKVIF